MGARRHATEADVLAYAPALSGLAAGILAAIVSATALLVSLEAWGTKAYDGHLNLAAHIGSRFLAGASVAGPAGPVTSRAIGAISTSYAAPTVEPSDGDLALSAYGQLYKMLRDSIIVVPLVTRGMCL